MQVGKVGAYTMYVRNGEQIVRQRKNSSNYGSEASRTNPQQIRRAKWGNIVNTFKIMKDWQPKAWETAVGGKTDYNEFVGRNINSSGIYLTKDMCANGCAVLDAFMVSQGSIAPIGLEWSSVDSVFDTHITLSAAPGPGKTVGVVSADIITNNPEFKNGDNLGIIFYSQQLDEREYPYLRSRYYEITLVTESTQQLSANPVYELIDLTESGSLCFSTPQLANWTDVGMVVIHTRKGNGLQVSTQKVVMCSDQFTQLFDTEAAMNAAIASYGQDNEVPLDPSFKSAVVQKVLWNGSVIYQKGVTSGRFRIEATEGGVLEIQGEGLNSRDVKLSYYDGSQVVEYTPLEVTGSSWKYILGANGHYTLVGNKYVLGSLELSGIVTPSELGLTRGMGQVQTSTESMGDAINKRNVNALCINYPFKATAEYGYFRLSIGFSSEPDTELLQGHGCTLLNLSSSSNNVSLTAQPTSPSEVCYVTYGDTIVAVFNYS